MANSDSTSLVLLRASPEQLAQLKLKPEQQQLFDSFKIALELKSRKSQQEILRERYITMGIHFMISGTAQVALPKNEMSKYKSRVTDADVYPIYTVEEIVALIVAEEVVPKGEGRPIFIVCPKEEPEVEQHG